MREDIRTPRRRGLAATVLTLCAAGARPAPTVATALPPLTVATALPPSTVTTAPPPSTVATAPPPAIAGTGLPTAPATIALTAPVAGQEVAAMFRDMEQLLLDSPELQMSTEVTSEGAFESSLRGTVSLSSGNRATLDVSGSFGGAAQLHLSSDGEQLRGGSAAGEFDVATPDHLNEAIVIGLTRMGILHNLARLVGGAPPDHMDGGVREWVQVVEVETSAEQDDAGRALRRFDFGLVVEGVRSGSASLWVDVDTSLPVRREQTVQFESGEMRVTEVYRFGGTP